MKIGETYETYAGPANAFLGTTSKFKVLEVLSNTVALEYEYNPGDVLWVTKERLNKAFRKVEHAKDTNTITDRVNAVQCNLRRSVKNHDKRHHSPVKQ